MLARLSIKNVALIERADIEFGEGLNVLSGETGAGKSVILDSVNFVLGAKADRSMIRYGESECMVKAEFIVPENSKSVQILREMDVDTDGEIIISRKFTDAGIAGRILHVIRIFRFKLQLCAVFAFVNKLNFTCLITFENNVISQSDHLCLFNNNRCNGS